MLFFRCIQNSQGWVSDFLKSVPLVHLAFYIFSSVVNSLYVHLSKLFN